MTEDNLRKILKEVLSEELDKRMIIKNSISIYNPYPMYCLMQHPNYKVTCTDHTELR